MDTIQIACPKCGSELKLRDRSMLGRKGKCPKCSYAFVLEEPEPLELEFAESEEVPDHDALASMEGAWVNGVLKMRGEEPPETAEEFRSPPPSAAPALPAAPRRTPQTAPAAPSAGPQAPRPEATFPVLSGSSKSFDPLAGLEKLASTDGTAARLKARQKRNAQRRNVGLMVGSVVLMAVGGVAYYAVNHVPAKPPVGGEELAEAAQNLAHDEVPATSNNAAADSEFASTVSPTKGKPIELQYVPFGSEIIINVHPAELWKEAEQRQELRYSLVAPTKFLESVFQDLFRKKPEQIEEAMICVIPGAQGTMPEIAAVVHLIDEVKKSQFLEDVGGERVDDFGHPVYIKGERAYLLPNQKTIAVGPKAQVREMVDAVEGRSGAGGGIEELLPMTDRDRHLTFIFVPQSLRLHSNYWFGSPEGKPGPLAALAHRFCNWLGDEVEATVWSFHQTEKRFYSEMLLRNVAGVTSKRLARDTQQKLDQFAPELLATVQMMQPREVGKRKIISRLPVMSDAFTMATTINSGPRHVQLITPLPERAAPNLALGTLLAWDESTRTDFTKKAPTKAAPSDGTKIPDLIVERLKMKIDVDFRRTPLQEAIAFIGNEIKTTFDIDGDALKAGGFTKNMPQTFLAEKTSVQEVIVKIVERFQDPQRPSNTLVIVIDESKKTLLLTTLAFAEQKNQKPFELFKK